MIRGPVPDIRRWSAESYFSTAYTQDYPQAAFGADKAVGSRPRALRAAIPKDSRLSLKDSSRAAANESYPIGNPWFG